MKIISLIILGIYMAFFIYNAAFSKTKTEKISSFILYMATCIPFIYILKGY